MATELPSISLPTGGGAIRSIGERFGVGLATGTGSLSVPLVSGVSGPAMGPELMLSYDSGAGNGPFGFGWRVSLPNITRKTDKGLPRYTDGIASDVFVLSGSDDLVPLLDDHGEAVRLTRVVHGITYDVFPYRPRIEGLFARIERWVQRDDQTSHWRSISRENVTTLYGLDGSSRISDPADPTRVFSWLICRTLDDRGRLTEYSYVAENSADVDLSQADEANRTDLTRSAQRYLKRIRYGFDRPYRPDWSRDGADLPLPTAWRFELVLDYGDHGGQFPSPVADSTWSARVDPFSSYRSGFELRTYRRCRRVLLFHHFPQEPEVGADCLVRSSTFTYSDEIAAADPTKPVYTFLQSITDAGYRRQNEGYLKASMPPVEFGYTGLEIRSEVMEVAADAIENVPDGVEGRHAQLVDLDGEGAPGILLDMGGAWGYKRNLSPNNRFVARDGTPVPRALFGALETVSQLPVPSDVFGAQRLMDLSGGGQLDVVSFEGQPTGYCERVDHTWAPFRPFVSLPSVAWGDPNVKLVDVTGDGLADILIADDNVYTVHRSLGVDGFADAEIVRAPWDEEQGPRAIFTNSTQATFLADMSGDGLSDLVRVGNGEVCYWPSLGYGRFGPKVSMGCAPRFTDQDSFDPRRIRLVDIDGSGTSDLLYIGDDGVQVCFNRSGNTWAKAQLIGVFPTLDLLSSVQASDFLGTGTGCLVWSSPVPALAGRMRYVDLLGGVKPHLLVNVRNNLGAETRVRYAPSTRYYVADRDAGRPWVTHLPHPVQVVERVETYDWIGRTRTVNRYAYHHGYFDSVEREFRGFGMVEQWDTQEHRDDDLFPDAHDLNVDGASFTPPTLTRTWIHTGAFVEADALSRQYAHEYWLEPSLRGSEPRAVAARHEFLLADSVLEGVATAAETREALRALKGCPLRIEVYGADHSASAANPYSVSEQNFVVRRLQPSGPNRHAVFATYPRETVTYHYERREADPRVTHDVTLELDSFGNVKRSVSIAYGRRPGYPEPEPSLSPAFRAMLASDQTRLQIGGTQRDYTLPVHTPWEAAAFDAYRAPLSSQTLSAEIMGIAPIAQRFGFAELDHHWSALWSEAHDIPVDTVPASIVDGQTAPEVAGRRITGRALTLYRRDDLSALLPLGKVETLAIHGESYRLALTTRLIEQVFGGALTPAMLSEAGYVTPTGQSDWWIPSGRTYYSPGDSDDAGQELASAEAHFFAPRRAVDPFGAVTRIAYDPYDLLPVATEDPLGNSTAADNDYRVLAARRIRDPNGNQTEAVFDCLGDVVGKAVSAQSGEGDTLAGFRPELTDAEIQAARADPVRTAEGLLGNATTRVIIDRHAYVRGLGVGRRAPPLAYTITREMHRSDIAPGQATALHHLFSYYDGFGREAQQKSPAEPVHAPGIGSVSARWIGSGWTIYNSKGNPVRRYEPFFSATHDFEFDRRVGVSSVLAEDPLGRVVAVLHPDNTFDKMVFDTWRQETWDRNDTVLVADPRTDPDVGEFLGRVIGDPSRTFVTWYQRYAGGTYGATDEERAANHDAAQKAAAHASTPTVTHFDSRGRPCVTVADNGSEPIGQTRYPTRTAIDVHGKPLAVFDALGHRVVEYFLRPSTEAGAGARSYIAGYDFHGTVLYSNSADGGPRRTFCDVAGNPLRVWDARGCTLRDRYDLLRRPTHRYVSFAGTPEVLVERLVYGERHPDATRYLKGRLFRHFDPAGVVGYERYDFKGNVVECVRAIATLAPPDQPAERYSVAPDWSTLADVADQPVLDVAALDAATARVCLPSNTFLSSNRYDALSRVIQSVLPHRADGSSSVIQHTYNAGGLLDHVGLWVRRPDAPHGILDPATADAHPMAKVDYNARGQRVRVVHGNGAETTYLYDAETFRLMGMTTVRPNPDPDARVVQQLAYTYDPIGNITRVHDNADIHAVVFFRNRRVDPTADFTYDPTYRLILATGREHLGQTGNGTGAPLPPADGDGLRSHAGVGPTLNPGDGLAMANYTERYAYDSVGGLQQMIHQAGGGGWTRRYAYREVSAISSTETSNRLSATSLPGDGADGPYSARYAYDAHGNVVHMPHLPRLTWDERDRLQSTTRQVVAAGMPETTYYLYDSDGARRLKTTFRQAAPGSIPSLKSERLYFPGLEVYREYSGAGVITLERETVHVMADEQRIAMVETRTQGSANDDPAPAQTVRYQYGNHLGSAVLELDEAAAVLTYEEYFPYGATSYQAVRSQTDTPKRYRYTGKERDEESGFGYHGARYYAPWLGRWTQPDPAGFMDGSNRYGYVSGNPIVLHDPTGRAPEPRQMWFFEARVYFQKVTATRSGRGISKAVRKNLQKMAQWWGYTGKVDASHAEKSFAVTKAGETTSVVAEPSEANRARGAEEAAQKAEQVNKGGFGREHGVDVKAPKGKRYGQPDIADPYKTEAFEKFKASSKSTPTSKPGPAAPAAETTSSTAKKAEQIEFNFGKQEAKAGAEAAKEATEEGAKKALVLGGEGTLKTEAKTGLKEGGKLLGTKAAKFVPVVGIVVGAGLVANDLHHGDYASAAWDTAEAIPVAGDVVGALHLGITTGTALNEGLGIENVAAEHGMAVEGAAKRLGLGEDASRIVGATGAALSSITVAPYIAINRKIDSWIAKW